MFNHGPPAAHRVSRRLVSRLRGHVYGVTSTGSRLAFCTSTGSRLAFCSAIRGSRVAFVHKRGVVQRYCILSLGCAALRPGTPLTHHRRYTHRPHPAVLQHGLSKTPSFDNAAPFHHFLAVVQTSCAPKCLDRDTARTSPFTTARIGEVELGLPRSSPAFADWLTTDLCANWLTKRSTHTL